MPGSAIRVSPELYTRLKRLQGLLLVERGIRLTYAKILEAVLSSLTEQEMEKLVKNTILASEEEE